MKHIYLLRHAEAIDPGGVDDFSRYLTPYGHKQVSQVKEYLVDKNITFDLVMCSTALRACETFEGLREAIHTSEIELSQSFYNVNEEKILDAFHLINDIFKTVLYIGHNPGIAFAAYHLAENAPHQIQTGYPTATLCGYQLPIQSWKELRWGKGQLVGFYSPEAD